ncbi:unnamed protein product [Cunninghamella blakesleeana]
MNERSNIFICKGCCSLGGKGRTIGVYLSGALFSIAWWVFIDGLCISEAGLAGFEDWVGGILTTLGLIIINLINKESLYDDGYGDSHTWRARLFLFFGFTLMAGGLSGSVAVLVVKYTSKMDPIPFIGITEVVQTGLLMISAAILWVSQQEQTDNFRI